MMALPRTLASRELPSRTRTLQIGDENCWAQNGHGLVNFKIFQISLWVWLGVPHHPKLRYLAGSCRLVTRCVHTRSVAASLLAAYSRMGIRC